MPTYLHILNFLHKTIKYLILTSLLLCGFGGSSQDLIVRSSGDSLNCHITKVSDSVIYFDEVREDRKSSSLSQRQIVSYQTGFYSRKDTIPAFQPVDSLRNSDRNISLELLGSGIVYSINFENRLLNRSNIRYSFGLDVLPATGTAEGIYIVLTSELHYLIGKHRHKLELGLGLSYKYNREKLNTRTLDGNKWYYNNCLFMSGRIGYRYERGRQIFKIGFVPIYCLEYYTDRNSVIIYRFLPWAGVAYGFKF